MFIFRKVKLRPLLPKSASDPFAAPKRGQNENVKQADGPTDINGSAANARLERDVKV